VKISPVTLETNRLKLNGGNSTATTQPQFDNRHSAHCRPETDWNITISISVGSLFLCVVWQFGKIRFSDLELKT